MGGLSWNGNRQPKYWTKNNRLYGVKVKLSYKSEGLERLFLQLIKEKLTNLDKFLPLNYHKILNSSPSPLPPPTFLFPLLEYQKNFSPATCPVWKSWSPPLYKSGGGGEGGRNYGPFSKPYYRKIYLNLLCTLPYLLMLL